MGTAVTVAKKTPARHKAAARSKASPPRAAAPAEEAAPPRAGGTLTGLIAAAAENTLAITPLVGLRRSDLAGAAGSLLKAVSGSPRRATSHYVKYLKVLGQVVGGKSQIAPEPKDRRFADAAWQSNAMYRRLMQAWLATQQELDAYIDGADLDKREKGRARFLAALVTDALAPSNWVLGNPAAVRKILDTGGDNLVKGLKNLVHDMRHNHMLPSQVNATPFQVGVNVATSPGRVVLRHEMFELLQFASTTPEVHARPLVMSPPQVNKYYAIDLAPEKSLVKWATDGGVQLFVVSWRNPTLEQGHWGLVDYVHALDAAVEAAREITKSPDVNMWGSCSGGMTLAAYLGWLAAKGERKVANCTWAACVLDPEAALEDSTLGLFSTPRALRAAKARSLKRGIVTGEELARMFAWLRPNDLVWNYWVNNYLLGNKPPAFDILAWNADTTRLPGRYHADLLDMVDKRPYVNANTLVLDELPIDLSKVEISAYAIGGITDHITPWPACYRTARLFGPQTTFVLANAGHLQAMVNPPGIPKAFFYAAETSVEDPTAWAALAEAQRHEGSWWLHWRGWIQGKSGPLVLAPKMLGSRKHKPLEAAPGTYVLER